MEELTQRIEQLASETKFSGVISIFRDASTLYTKAYGYRDIKNHLPNTTNTAFGIASGTKFFTALGIGVLIDQGLLSLDTTIGKIAQEYAGFIDQQATIQQLLTHTSGIYDYYDEEIETDFENFFVEIPWYKLETPSDYYPLFKGHVPKFRPGERYSYSNGGFVLLGMLIEKLTGSLVSMPSMIFLKTRRMAIWRTEEQPTSTTCHYEALEMEECIRQQMISALFGTACFRIGSFLPNSRRPS
jgi:CubicO group peptidase (beta-lactamase class C family)